MQELCRALTGPLEELYEKLPPIENERCYRIRYCSAFFPDLMYKTRFLEYIYRDAIYDKGSIHSGLSYLLKNSHAIAPLCIYKIDGDLTEEEYFDYLRSLARSFVCTKSTRREK